MGFVYALYPIVKYIIPFIYGVTLIVELLCVLKMFLSLVLILTMIDNGNDKIEGLGKICIMHFKKLDFVEFLFSPRKQPFCAPASHLSHAEPGSCCILFLCIANVFFLCTHQYKGYENLSREGKGVCAVSHTVSFHSSMVPVAFHICARWQLLHVPE